MIRKKQKKNLFIEIILDIENKIKKLEENYNIEDIKKLKYKIQEEIKFIEKREKLYIEQDYGKMDDEVLEIFEEKLKKLEERIKALESKYQWK